MCVGDCSHVFRVCVFVFVFARRQLSNPSQNRIRGGGEWPSSIFDEPNSPNFYHLRWPLLFLLTLYFSHLLSFLPPSLWQQCNCTSSLCFSLSFFFVSEVFSLHPYCVFPIMLIPPLWSSSFPPMTVMSLVAIILRLVGSDYLGSLQPSLFYEFALD